MSDQPERDEQARHEPQARRLDPRVRLVWALQGVLTALVAGLLALVFEVAALRLALGARPPWPPGLPAVLLALLVAGVGWWWAAADYRSWRYTLTDEALELRHGVVVRTCSAIPYFRVQHVDIAQGPLERSFGLARLVVHTASASTDKTIPGVRSAEAQALRQVILARTGSGDAV